MACGSIRGSLYSRKWKNIFDSVARAAAAAFLAQGKPKLGGADGALREDHCPLCVPRPPWFWAASIS